MPAPAAFGRSSLVGMLLAYAVLTLGVCGLSRATTCASAPAPAPVPADSPGLRAFLGPVAPGMSLGTWTIAQVDPPRRGALTITLRPRRGPDVALAVTRLVPGGPRPLARTPTLAVFRGEHVSSDSSTPADELAAAAALAELLAAREALAPAPLDLLTPP